MKQTHEKLREKCKTTNLLISNQKQKFMIQKLQPFDTVEDPLIRLP